MTTQKNIYMACIFTIFEFLGFHLFFLSIEIGWKYLRLRRIGTVTQAVVHAKECKASTYYLSYRFIARDTNTDINYVVTQRMRVSQVIYDRRMEGDAVKVVYEANRPRNNLLQQDLRNGCSCYIAIFLLTLFSIPWILAPFFWSNINHHKEYTLDFTTYIMFSVAFVLWLISRIICFKCCRSKSCQVEEARINDIQQCTIHDREPHVQQYPYVSLPDSRSGAEREIKVLQATVQRNGSPQSFT